MSLTKEALEAAAAYARWNAEPDVRKCIFRWAMHARELHAAGAEIEDFRVTVLGGPTVTFSIEVAPDEGGAEK